MDRIDMRIFVRKLLLYISLDETQALDQFLYPLCEYLFKDFCWRLNHRGFIRDAANPRSIGNGDEPLTNGTVSFDVKDKLRKALRKELMDLKGKASIRLGLSNVDPSLHPSEISATIRIEKRKIPSKDAHLFRDNVRIKNKHHKNRKDAKVAHEVRVPVVEDAALQDLNACLSSLEEVSFQVEGKDGYPIKETKLSLKHVMYLFTHAWNCKAPQCTYPMCHRMKRVVQHALSCNNRYLPSDMSTERCCTVCTQLIDLCMFHAEGCKAEKCDLPICGSLREKIKQSEIIENRMHNMLEDGSSASIPSVDSGMARFCKGEGGGKTEGSSCSKSSSDKERKGKKNTAEGASMPEIHNCMQLDINDATVKEGMARLGELLRYPPNDQQRKEIVSIMTRYPHFKGVYLEFQERHRLRKKQ